MPTHAHVPVLLNEAMQALDVQPGGVYVDATYGRGGHSAEILRRLGANGRLLAMDRDPQAVADARSRFAGDARFHVEHGPFSMLAAMIDAQAVRGAVNGILFDLGVSSPQLDDVSRGFSFRQDGPLDMRMDTTRGPSASEWLATVDESELARVIRDYGEERFAHRVARAIVQARGAEPITTTRQLAEIVRRAVPTRERDRDSATRSFQAIRIFINRELEEIETALPQAVEALAPGGRLVVISFHSLEDRIAKHFIRVEARGQEPPPGMPVRAVDIPVRLKPLGKPVFASPAEIAANPRARSAVLRVAERLAGGHA